MVIADGHIRYSLCGFRCYKRGVNLFKSLSAVLVHRDLFSHKNRPHSFCKICKLGMRSDFFKNKAKTLENTRFSRVWSCWADLNRRPHPYQAIFDVFHNNSRLFLTGFTLQQIISRTFQKHYVRCFLHISILHCRRQYKPHYLSQRH